MRAGHAPQGAQKERVTELGLCLSGTATSRDFTSAVPAARVHPALHAASCCAVSLCPQDKVRAVSFDQQQQQVVALSTDDTMSWWTADLQLKGSARLSNIRDPVSVATNGSTVAIGSVGHVHVLDTRAPNGGLQRPTSRDLRQHTAAGRHSRHPPFTGSLCMSARLAMQCGPLDAAAAAAQPVQPEELLLLRRFLQVNWLPPAYRNCAPVRPVVLAVTGPVRGMQALQQTASYVGMDPCTVEQLLRREAATLAVAQGKPFDAALEHLLGRLAQLQPRQQLQELKALQQKCSAQQQQPQSQQPREPPLPEQFRMLLAEARSLSARGLDIPGLERIRQFTSAAPASESEASESEFDSDADDDDEPVAAPGSPGGPGPWGTPMHAAGSRWLQGQPPQQQQQQGVAQAPPPEFKARVTSQLVLDESVVRV